MKLHQQRTFENLQSSDEEDAINNPPEVEQTEEKELVAKPVHPIEKEKAEQNLVAVVTVAVLSPVS